MERTRTPRFITWATLGKCSLIAISGALVLIGLKSPEPLLSGLRSKVSLWLGPPSIQRRMQDLAVLLPAAALARTGSQPERAGANAPAADSLRKSRRVFSCNREENIGSSKI